MRKILLPLLLVLVAFAGAVFAFLPINWSEDWAKDDYQHSDAVVIGRVIGFWRYEEKITDPTTGKEDHWLHYSAKFRVAKVFRGTAAEGDVLEIYVGCDEQPQVDDSVPTRVCLANTQNGFDCDLFINGVYILFLSNSGGLWPDKGPNGIRFWGPRSGPYS